jgi:hypothetical protein
MILRIH